MRPAKEAMHIGIEVVPFDSVEGADVVFGEKAWVCLGGTIARPRKANTRAK